MKESFTNLWELNKLPLTELLGSFDSSIQTFDQALTISDKTGHVQLANIIPNEFLYTESNYSFRTGSSFKSRTRVVDLSEQTIQDNSRFFGSVDDVPKQAITMGLATIMESKRIVLMVNSVDKLNILNVAMDGEVTESVPASILQRHNNVEVYYCD